MKKHSIVIVLSSPAREDTIITFMTIIAINSLLSRCKAPISRLLPHSMAANNAKKGDTTMSKANAEVHKAILINWVK